MNLRRFFLFLLMGSSLFFSACSAYQSSGRKSFESKASGNINPAGASTGIEVSPDWLENQICWSQLATEPLWHVEPGTPSIITKLNEDEIQVCYHPR